MKNSKKYEIREIRKRKKQRKKERKKEYEHKKKVE